LSCHLVSTVQRADLGFQSFLRGFGFRGQSVVLGLQREDFFLTGRLEGRDFAIVLVANLLDLFR
jgi:hypothetical protein